MVNRDWSTSLYFIEVILHSIANITGRTFVLIQGVNIHAIPINSTKVEAPITGHLRDYVPYLEKYEAVQNFLM
jgi:hypothetical protein